MCDPTDAELVDILGKQAREIVGAVHDLRVSHLPPPSVFVFAGVRLISIRIVTELLKGKEVFF